MSDEAKSPDERSSLLSRPSFPSTRHPFVALESELQQCRAIIRDLQRAMYLDPSNWRRLLSWRVIKAIFWQRDPVLMAAARVEFQAGLQRKLELLRSTTHYSENELQAEELDLMNQLALYVFFDPNPHDRLQVPQYIDQQWVLCGLSH